MKDEDYILASLIGRVQSLINVIQGISPGIDASIPKDEYDAVRKTIREWEVRLFEAVEEKKNNQ